MTKVDMGQSAGSHSEEASPRRGEDERAPAAGNFISPLSSLRFPRLTATTELRMLIKTMTVCMLKKLTPINNRLEAVDKPLLINKKEGETCFRTLPQTLCCPMQFGF